MYRTLNRGAPLVAIGIGLCIWDTLISLDGYPKEDGKLPVQQIASKGGGPTATALKAMARLGLATGYMGALGCDEPGDRMAAEFERYGVDTRYLERVPGASPVAFVLVNKAARTRTILHHAGGAPKFSLSRAHIEALRTCRLLHVEGRGEVDVTAALIARGAGAVVSLDAGTVRPGMERIMALTNLLIMSESFLLEFTGIDDPGEALLAVNRRFEPKVCVVTRGASGGLWLESGEMNRYPAFPVDAIDTTGAGDVFHGAFAYGYMQAWPTDRICRFASAAAAMKCATGEIPALHEVDGFVRDRIENGRARQ